MTDIEAVRDACRGSFLANEDLLPTKQTWNWYNIFAFWMSDVHSAGGYVFAGTLFSLGLAGWQVFVSLILGILIVQVLANLIGVPSQKCAVPFPVMSRMTFGVLGSNIPALIRGIIAIVWYGIQTYLASAAMLVIVLYFIPSAESLVQTHVLGLSVLGWICFLTMWLLQTALFLCSMNVIRHFIDWAGPIVYVVMVVLMIYIIIEAGWGEHFVLAFRRKAFIGSDRLEHRRRHFAHRLVLRRSYPQFRRLLTLLQEPPGHAPRQFLGATGQLRVLLLDRRHHHLRNAGGFW